MTGETTRLSAVSMAAFSLLWSWAGNGQVPEAQQPGAAVLQQGAAPGASRVILLGTGNPVPDPARSGPAVAIVVNGTAYLVDMGPGVVRRAEKAAMEKDIPALKARNLAFVFATHLHSDHTLGFADLIFTPSVMGRYRPLNVFGPPGIEAMAGHLVAAYEKDIAVRSEGGSAAEMGPTLVSVQEIEDGLAYRDRNITVHAIAVNHGTWDFAFGYRFETPDRVIVVSGDTAPSERLIEKAAGCDVLIHEVYSAESLLRVPPHAVRYHSTFHTSGIELGQIAARIKPKLLVLYHQLSFSTKEEILREIRENYSGKVAYGEDLDEF